MVSFLQSDDYLVFHPERYAKGIICFSVYDEENTC